MPLDGGSVDCVGGDDLGQVVACADFREQVAAGSVREVQIAPDRITGTLNNDGTMTNDDTLTNIGTLNNSHTLTNQGWLHNHGTLTNSGTLNNNGLLWGGGALTNDGTLNNNGALQIAGTLTNRGTLINSGTMTTGPGTLINVGTSLHQSCYRCQASGASTSHQDGFTGSDSEISLSASIQKRLH